MNEKAEIYGLMAEFDDPDDLLHASTKAYEAGYRRLDAYTPFPIEGLSEAVGFKRPRLPLIVLIGGLIGALVGFGLQYYTSVIDYPMNVGGRPFNSWPAFVPITFELMILFAAFSAVLGMFALNGLPQPYHPVFNIPRFATASRDRFFLCIESRDPMFDLKETTKFLEQFKPGGLFEVEP